MREVTIAQFEAMFSTYPPDITPKEWNARRLEALTTGVFDMGGETYQLKPDQRRGIQSAGLFDIGGNPGGDMSICEYDGKKCLYTVTRASGVPCSLICGRWTACVKPKKRQPASGSAAQEYAFN